MRIGMISNLRGGLGQFVLSLSRGLMKKNIEVEILCPAHLSRHNLQAFDDDIRPIRFGANAMAAALTKRYDVLHCNIAALCLPAAIRSRTGSFPILETFHGFPQWGVEPRLLQKMEYAMEQNSLQFVARSARVRVSVSQFIRRVILQKFGIDSIVIHHGIDHQPSQEAMRRELRELFGIDDDVVAILFVGRLHPYKGPVTLLHAFNTLAKARQNLRLLFVGDGPLSIVVQTRVRELGLDNSVIRWRRVSSSLLQSIYSASDILCLPSTNEAFGYVLLEAMDHSLPTLVSASGAPPEIVGDAGLTFRTGDEIDLVNKLLRLIDDPRLRQRLGTKARERVRTHFSMDSMVERYVSAYEKAMACGDR